MRLRLAPGCNARCRIAAKRSLTSAENNKTFGGRRCESGTATRPRDTHFFPVVVREADASLPDAERQRNAAGTENDGMAQQ